MRLNVCMLGCKTYVRDIEHSADLCPGRIVLEADAQTQGKVVITADMVERLGDRRECTLTNAGKKQHGSALKTLESLPRIIIADQKVSSMGGKAVKILIDGVPYDSKNGRLLQKAWASPIGGDWGAEEARKIPSGGCRCGRAVKQSEMGVLSNKMRWGCCQTK